jgi:hypothetical protein
VDQINLELLITVVQVAEQVMQEHWEMEILLQHLHHKETTAAIRVKAQQEMEQAVAEEQEQQVHLQQFLIAVETVETVQQTLIQVHP